MPVYKIDGEEVDTEDTSACWRQESEGWDYRPRATQPTEYEQHDERLFRAKDGRYFVEHSMLQVEKHVRRSSSDVEWVGHAEAASWLIANGYKELPSDLALASS